MVGNGSNRAFSVGKREKGGNDIPQYMRKLVADDGECGRV